MAKRGVLQPIEQWPPDAAALLPVQPLREHLDLEHVVATHVRLLPPMLVEQVRGVEADELAQQHPVGLIRGRSDLEIDDAEIFRQIVGANRHFRHRRKGATPAAC